LTIEDNSTQDQTRYKVDSSSGEEEDVDYINDESPEEIRSSSKSDDLEEEKEGEIRLGGDESTTLYEVLGVEEDAS
jgi:hypothetical protein